MVYVIAESWRQFREWQSRQENPRTFVYVSGPERLLGLRDVEIQLVGEWWQRGEIIDEAIQRGLLKKGAY